MSAEGAAAPLKVVAVTGASSGIGRGIAVAAARAGMRVALADLTEDVRPGNYDESPDLATAALIASEGGEAVFISTDVSNKVAADKFVTKAVERFGRLDVLVNNAGVFRAAPFHEMTEEQFDAVWNVVARGSWLVSQAAVRQFLAQGGPANIVNVVSAAGIRAGRGFAAYNVAKAAQAQLTRCLALEYGPAGVRVNGVCPGPVNTGMGGVRPSSPAAANRPLPPLGRKGEIADAVELAMFLMSDKASFITGALVPLDGGDTLGVVRSL